MSKIVDDNGFWEIKANPITKEGVFPYLGKSISPQLEPERIYQVYRGFDELSNPDTLKSFDGVPFINDHEMIGDGFTRYDQRPAAGVLMNPTADNGMIRGDLKIFSEELKNAITNGKKELSLGYKCEYALVPGEWNGIKYDAIQRNIRGNHIALVNRGRMGADVRVYDSGITMDAAEIIEEVTETVNNNPDKGEKTMAEEKNKPEVEETEKGVAGEDESVDKRKLIDEIGGILKDKVSEEVWRTIIGKIEKAAYNASENGKATDEEETKEDGKEEAKAEDSEAAEKEGEETEAEDKKCGDEFFDAPKTVKLINQMKAAGEISAEAAEKLTKGLESGHYRRAENATDSFAEVEKAITKKIDSRNALHDALTPHIGDFACDGWTLEDVAKYGCEKLGLDAADGAEVATVKGYLAGCTKTQKEYAMDAAVTASPKRSSFLDKYVNGNK